MWAGARLFRTCRGWTRSTYLTNSSMMGVDFLPKHLIVVGGSYIGLEFGQMFRRFGSEVTILEMGPRLIGARRRRCLGGDAGDSGARGNPGSPERQVHRVFEAGRRGGGARRLRRRVRRKSTGRTCCWRWGAVPNTDDLGLDKAGVATDAHGYIAVDDQLRTNVPGIWAMGDCNGKGAFTHTSYNDFEIVAANLLDNDPRRVSDRIPCYALYIDPPLGARRA